MRLSDMTKDLSNMSEEELIAHVRAIRDRKYVEKPATKKRVADVEKKEKNIQLKGMDKLLATMTDEQKAELLKQLESGNG